MTVLTLDETVLSALRSLNGPAELRDRAGTLIGHFTPNGNRPPYKTTPFTEADLAEIQRRMANPRPGVTTRQLFEHLKTLTSDPVELADLQQHIDALAERDRCHST